MQPLSRDPGACRQPGVGPVAVHLDRTVHATEALLVRARHAFRVAYGERSDG